MNRYKSTRSFDELEERFVRLGLTPKDAILYVDWVDNGESHLKGSRGGMYLKFWTRLGEALRDYGIVDPTPHNVYRGIRLPSHMLETLHLPNKGLRLTPRMLSSWTVPLGAAEHYAEDHGYNECGIVLRVQNPPQPLVYIGRNVQHYFGMRHRDWKAVNQHANRHEIIFAGLPQEVFTPKDVKILQKPGYIPRPAQRS